MIPDPRYVSESIVDALKGVNPMLDAIAQARTQADEATAQVRALKEALADLEADAQVEALESGAKNEDGRKAAARAFLKNCQPYQSLRGQLADALAAENRAKASLEDCERRLKTHERGLPALVVLAEMVCQTEARQTAQIKLEGQRLYKQGCDSYKAAADTQLAARQGVATSGR